MARKYWLVFDEIMFDQIRKLGENQQVRDILSGMFDKMELLGPRAGDLVDSQLFIYEMKSKHPPIRLYYKHVAQTDELYVFEYEMKTSPRKQQKTIRKLSGKAREKFRSPGPRA